MSLKSLSMDHGKDRCDSYAVDQSEIEEIMQMRKGPWTREEDLKLIDGIAIHGPRRWSYLAVCAGLKRTGKSCRLRWLNYLHPDVKHGNLTLQEQLLVLDLHSRWGNRWSMIAQQLPGRTDNEIKNYWRTRVQKIAKRLNCDVNSTEFRGTIHHFCLPRLVEQLRGAAAPASPQYSNFVTQSPPPATTTPSAGNGGIIKAGLPPVDSNSNPVGIINSSDASPEARSIAPPASSDLTTSHDHQVPDSNWWRDCLSQDGSFMDLMSTEYYSAGGRYEYMSYANEMAAPEQSKEWRLDEGDDDSDFILISNEGIWPVHDAGLSPYVI